MRRWLSLWLPNWPIERMARRRRFARGTPMEGGRTPADAEPLPLHEPFALVRPVQGVPRLFALNEAARGKGLTPGTSLTDARAAVPGLAVRDAEPEEDAAALEALALWCGRWSPRVAADGADGILIDITGCAHLFGGEQALLADLTRQLARRGFSGRAAVAGRRLAAWAWARHGRFQGAGDILPAADAARLLATLPVQALRLEQDTVDALGRLGFRHIGQLQALPQASLLTRFGETLVRRLDALARDDELMTLLHEPQRFTARLSFAEPIGRTEDVEAAARRLLQDIAGALDKAQRGARRLRLSLCRVDGSMMPVEIGTGRPVREPEHLFRLLRLELDGLDMGFGVELMLLEALATAPLAPRQAGLAERADEVAIGRLADQLTVRLGKDRILRPQPLDSHLPERAVEMRPASETIEPQPWLARTPRPLRLLDEPRRLDAMAFVPDGPPIRLSNPRGARRVLHAEGPERLLGEWWRTPDRAQPSRDYWRVLLEDGRELWLYREGAVEDPASAVWSLHGFFL